MIEKLCLIKAIFRGWEDYLWVEVAEVAELHGKDGI